MRGTSHPARSPPAQDISSARAAAAGAAEDRAQGAGKAWNNSVHLVALAARTCHRPLVIPPSAGHRAIPLRRDPGSIPERGARLVSGSRGPLLA